MKPTVPETGKVISLDGGNALVMIEGGKGCKGCGAAKIGLCRAGGKTMFLTARNNAFASPGDRVIMVIDRSAGLKGYMLAYIIPIAAFIAGAGAGSAIGRIFSVPFPDVIGAFGFLAATLSVTLKMLGRLDRSYSMEIKRVVSDGRFNEFPETEEERLALKYIPR